MVATFINFEIKVAGSQINHYPIWVCAEVEMNFWFKQKKIYYLIILTLRWILYLSLDNLFSKDWVFCFKKQVLEAITQVEFTFLWKFAHFFSLEISTSVCWNFASFTRKISRKKEKDLVSTYFKKKGSPIFY